MTIWKDCDILQSACFIYHFIIQDRKKKLDICVGLSLPPVLTFALTSAARKLPYFHADTFSGANHVFAAQKYVPRGGEENQVEPQRLPRKFQVRVSDTHSYRLSLFTMSGLSTGFLSINFFKLFEFLLLQHFKTNKNFGFA